VWLVGGVGSGESSVIVGVRDPAATEKTRRPEGGPAGRSDSEVAADRLFPSRVGCLCTWAEPLGFEYARPTEMAKLGWRPH
jgi:hypothetical protein